VRQRREKVEEKWISFKTKEKQKQKRAFLPFKKTPNKKK